MEEEKEKNIIRRCGTCGKKLQKDSKFKSCGKCRAKWRRKDKKKRKRKAKMKGKEKVIEEKVVEEKEKVLEEKDVKVSIRKCSKCGKGIDEESEHKWCEECRKARREEARRDAEKRKERIRKEKSVDLFDFSGFKDEEQQFLKTRLRKYNESEEYDLNDPVVEYQLYSILIEELEIRKLRLGMMKGDRKKYQTMNDESHLAVSYKRLRDLWGDLNALIRQKLPDGSKKLSLAEQIKEMEEKKKEIRNQRPEKEKMRKVLDKRIKEEDI